MRERVLGQKHPDTLMSVYNLASLLQTQKQYSESWILYQRACLEFQKCLGSNHPRTIEYFKGRTSLHEEMKLKMGRKEGPFQEAETLWESQIAQALTSFLPNNEHQGISEEQKMEITGGVGRVLNLQTLISIDAAVS